MPYAKVRPAAPHHPTAPRARGGGQHPPTPPRPGPPAQYVQLSTVRADGKGAANRTIVFRGFLGEGQGAPPDAEGLTFVTDARSGKVADVAACPWVELAWYFPGTREQYRVHGRMELVGDAGHPLGPARQAAWAKLTGEARKQFLWPEPGLPRTLPEAAFKGEAGGGGAPSAWAGAVPTPPRAGPPPRPAPPRARRPAAPPRRRPQSPRGSPGGTRSQRLTSSWGC